MKTRTLALAGSLMLAASLAQAQQGVTATEIMLGSHQDLSGPAVTLGVAARNGMQMRVDEINAAGGIHGRMLKLIVEDTGFEPRRAVQAAQKLVGQDGVFAIISSLGTAQSIAAMPVALDNGVFHLFPMGGGRQLYEPVEKGKYASVSSTFSEFQVAVPRLLPQIGAKTACAIHLEDEAGLEIMRGTKAGLDTLGMPLAATASYKRGDTDFSSQLQVLMAAKCDFVAIGGVLRDAIAIATTAQRMEFRPAFLGSQAIYSDALHKLGGPAVEGIYATSRAQQPYEDDPSPEIREWYQRYVAAFGEPPNGFTLMGYSAINSFALIAEAAGPDLTADSFTAAIESVQIPGDKFGNPPMSWTAERRRGSEASRISQIQNGRWVVVADY